MSWSCYPKNRRYTAGALLLSLGVLLLSSVAAEARSYSLGSTGFELSGDLALTFRELDRHSRINENNRGDDPFASYRLRLFINKRWDRIELASELFWDAGAQPRIQGAYLSFYELGRKSIYLQAGLIPSPFGNYGHRSTYFNQNPLIGVPVMWHYHSPFHRDGHTRNEDLFPRKGYDKAGMPMAYDACWDMGLVLGIEEGIVESKAAITLGTLSNPRAYTNDGYQGIFTAGLAPLPGLRFGGSVAYGPWMSPADYEGELEQGYPVSSLDDHHLLSINYEEHMQSAVGGYLESSFGHWQFFSEAMWIEWESPLLYEGALSASSGYLEGRWSFLPGWYLAGRYDLMLYGEISTTNDGSGPARSWAWDFDRIEAALGWRIVREGFIRLAYQSTLYRSASAEDVQLLALQFLFAF